MERISIFNYEAFYLDFLEGNLGEKDSKLLKEFLTANPDLKMEDESLPVFELSETKLASSLKNGLKQPTFDEKITLGNVEYFMLSHVEGLLDDDKAQELETFIGDRLDLLKDQRIYSRVHFRNDELTPYSEKEDLKRKQRVLYWPYVAGAAAACALVAVLVWSSNNNVGIEQQMGEQIVAEKSEKESIAPNLENSSVQEITKNKTPEFRPSKVDEKEVQTKVENLADNAIQNKSDGHQVEKMARKPVSNILPSIDNRILQPIANNSVTPIEEENLNQDYAAISSREMGNPIEPITNFISDRTNTQVDFRTAKKTENSPGGFSVKVGKFGLSRTTH